MKKALIITSSVIIVFFFASLSSRVDYDISTIGPEKGSLLIIGGNAQSDKIWNELKRLMGGADKSLVVIPTASTSDTLSDEWLENFKKGFIRRGFTNVTVLHTRDRKVANTDEFIRPLRTASAVWFSGGRQWRHADSYLNTRTHEACWQVLNRGGVIAGSSAGATIQGSYLARGDTKANTIMMGDHEEGLGFIKNVAIDQHLMVRNRHFDMFEILEKKPELLGIGLDENTAIVVQKDRFRVIGESFVAIYDGTRWSAERDTIYKLSPGDKQFYYLRAGDEYNLQQRKVIEFNDRTFVDLDRKTLQRYVGKFVQVNDTVSMELFVEKDTLRATQSWNKATFLLVPETRERFFIKGTGLDVVFELDQNNKVTGFAGPRERELRWVRSN